MNSDHINGAAPLKRPAPVTEGTSFDATKTLRRPGGNMFRDWLLFVMRDLRHLDTAAAPDLADWIVYLELEGKADRTPMIRVPKIKHPDRFKGDTFTLAEVALLEGLPEPHGQLFAVLFGTGLRKSEARYLRREHVDLERRRLTVVNGKGGKTRIVAMTPSALTAVGDLDLFERLGPEDHLWHSKPGGGHRLARRDPVAHTTFSRWYTACLTQAGVRYLRPHTTRHTYHELLRLAGLNLEERQALMGHVSIRTTADIYGHLDFDQVADKLSTFRIEDV